MSGRTLQVIHGSPDAMFQRAERFISECAANEKPASYNGLANALGVTLRTLQLYAADPETTYQDSDRPEEWRHGVRRCMALIDQCVEELMYTKGANPAGPIFALKNRTGGLWADKTEIEQRVSFTDLRSVFGDVLMGQIASNPPQVAVPSKANNIPDAVLIDSKPAPE